MKTMMINHVWNVAAKLNRYATLRSMIQTMPVTRKRIPGSALGVSMFLLLPRCAIALTDTRNVKHTAID